MVAFPAELLLRTKEAEVAVNRNLLVLFSPLVRDCLAAIPPCVTPTIFLPDVSLASVISLKNLLCSGTSTNFWVRTITVAYIGDEASTGVSL